MTPEVFNRTWLPLADRLRQIARQLTGCCEDAEDALQDLYVKLWRNHSDLDKVEIPMAYATTLLRNICLDMQRRRRVRSTLPLEAGREKSSGEEENRFEHANALARTMAALEQIPATQRAIVRLRILEDKTFDEIAQELGHSPLYIRVQLSMARKTLKKILDRTV